MRKLLHWIPIAILLGLVFSRSAAVAQTTADCTDKLAELMTSVQSACMGLAPGQACVQDEIVDLATLDTLETQALDPEIESWDAVVLQISTSDTDQPIQIALFGDTTVTNQISGDRPTIEASNTASVNINLRGGPGIDFSVVGSFRIGGTGTIDGKNAAGDWVHIRTEESMAWIYAPLLEFADGELDDLVVLDDLYTEPMQVLNLTTDSEQTTCGAGTVGLLVQYTGDNAAHLQVNGIDLAFQTTTLLLKADNDDTLQITVLEGTTSINTISAEAGAVVQAAVDTEPTTTQESYAFAEVVGLPYGLIADDTLSCVAGILDDTVVNAYRMADIDSELVAEAHADSHYRVTGWVNDENEDVWWRVSVDGNRAWVLQDSIQTAGACELVAEVSSNIPTASTSGGSGGSGGGGSGTASALVPPGTSIWQAVPSADNMSGTCNTPPVVLCEHLAAITPSGNTISWRGQEPTPYNMWSVGGDTYVYNGRNRLGNANLNLTLTFTSSTTWTMTWQQVFDSDPQCTHTFYYTASFLR